MSLEARLQHVLRFRGWSEREWSQKAGLSPGAVQAILRRVRGDEEASARAETLKKLAQAARVDYAWLSTGEGEGPGPVPTAGVVIPIPAPRPFDPAPGEPDPYPNRTIALKVLGDRLHPRARDVLASMTFPGDAGDLTIDEWLEQAKVWHRRALEVETELTSIEASVKGQAGSGSPAKRPAKG